MLGEHKNDATKNLKISFTVRHDQGKIKECWKQSVAYEGYEQTT